MDFLRSLLYLLIGVIVFALVAAVIVGIVALCANYPIVGIILVVAIYITTPFIAYFASYKWENTSRLFFPWTMVVWVGILIAVIVIWLR